MKKKRLFQILDEMNVHDAEHKTRLVAVCTQVISVDTVKQGVKISMGAPVEHLSDILNDKVIPILLMVDKAEYLKRDIQSDQQASPTSEQVEELKKEIMRLEQAYIKMAGYPPPEKPFIPRV